MPRYQIVRMIGLKLNRNQENSFFWYLTTNLNDE